MAIGVAVITAPISALITQCASAQVPTRINQAGATADQVDSSIKRAVTFLYSRQNPQGNWDVPAPTSTEPHGISAGQWGGTSALVVYALLAAGEDPNNPKLKQGIEWVRTADIRGVYALGMRAQIWLYLPRNQQNRLSMERDASLLVSLQNRNFRSPSKEKPQGGWDYLAVSDRIDLSVTQYGILGLWAAAQYGITIPNEVWQTNELLWANYGHVLDPSNNQWTRAPTPEMLVNSLRSPESRVGWSYTGFITEGHPIVPAITTAGAASLFITQEYLRSNSSVGCNGNQNNLIIDAAMRNLADDIPLIFSERELKHRYYTIYGIERTGVASGLKYFGENDWFKIGSKYLVARQGGDGSFGGWDNGAVVNTCFSLLFLSRGREPVMMNKLKYDVADAAPSRPRPPARTPTAPAPNPAPNPAPGASAAPTPPVKTREGHWNQRPRDVAHLARFVGKQTEASYNWQILDLAFAPLQDLLEAPILYISGGQRIQFSDDQVNKLRDYVERGGIILFNPDCGARPFIQGVEALAKQLFPDREFAEVPENHPLMKDQLFQVGKMKGRKPRLRAVTNGARVLLVLPADDLGKSWQSKEVDTRTETFQIATNLFQYATDKEFAQVKGRSYLVLPDPQVQTTQTIRVARLAYTGSWNPEPGGWRQLAAVMRNTRRIDLQVQNVDCGKEKLDDFKIAHLTGTAAFKFNDEQRKSIKAFVDRGGLLVVDAAGGSSEFKTAVETEFATIFGQQAATELTVRQLPANSPLYTAGGGAIDKIKYRTFAQTTVGSIDTAQIRGYVVNGRLGIVYSPEDLSVGIVGNPVDGIIGYAPATAAALMQRILIYGDKPTPVSTGK